MTTISLCMIVKNEHDVLARCLDSVKDVVDEIIIVDTGSVDTTREIAKGYTQKVFDFPWIEDFAAARNFAFEKGEMDYCMWLDADDILTLENRAALAKLKQELDHRVDVVMMKYNIAFDENDQPVFSFYRERLIKNHQGLHWVGAVHEVIELTGNIIYSDIAIEHRKLQASDPDRNLRIYEQQLQNGAVLDARSEFYYGRELMDHARYEEAIKIFQNYLKRQDGWLENQIEALRQLSVCFGRLNRSDEALTALLQTLALDVPRAEVCCDLGYHFLAKGALNMAIYWYETALRVPENENNGGFVQIDCYGYIPCLWLCVCYDRLGEREEAFKYNERAGALKPYSQAYQHNRSYFESFNL